MDAIFIQEYHDIEIVCIDDGSIDNSLEILTAYRNKYSNVTVIHNDNNKGAGYSRNKGMQNSKGEYLWFVDADDYIEPMSLKKIRKLLMQDHLDILCFDMKVMKEEIAIIRHLLADFETEIKTGRELFCQIVSSGVLRASACGQIYRNQYLQEKKLAFTEGTMCEDAFFSIKALIGAEKVKYVQEAFYTYHRNVYSVSTKTPNDKFFIGAFAAYCNMFDFWYSKRWDHVTSNCIVKYFSDYYNIAKRHFNAGEKESIDSWMENSDKLIYRQYQLFLNKEFGRAYLKNIGKEKAEIMKQYNDCIIYGAGTVAKEFIEIANGMIQHILAYAISKDDGTNPKNIYGVPVIPISSLTEYRESALVIIATLPDKYESIENTLRKLGFFHVLELINR